MTRNHFAIRRQLRDNIIRSQPLDKQQQMTQLFEMLMEGVERNLLTRSRDRCALDSLFQHQILMIYDETFTFQIHSKPQLVPARD